MRAVFIGIDSFDSELAAKYWDQLPNLRRLASAGGIVPAESTYPPDSVTAWASIHTGLNPAKHGMVYFKDPLEKVNATVNEGSDSGPIRGKTIWDMLGAEDRKSTLVFPKGAFPLWPVVGTAIARSEVREVAFQASDPKWIERMYEVAKRHGLSDLNTLQHIPTSDKDLEEWLDKGRRLVRAEYEFARMMAAETEWDFFLVYSSVMDWVSHNFWPYCDESDIDFKGDNKVRHAIRDLYILYDDEIGKLVVELPSSTPIIVASDHGHGRRPRRVVNLNKVLHERKLLVRREERSRIGGRKASARTTEALRRASVRFVNRNRWIWNAAMRGIKWFPQVRRFYTSPPVIDWERSLAFITDQSGIKSYNYGGIMLNRRAIDAAGREYEAVRTEAVRALSEIRHPDTGEPLFRHLHRREEVYEGQFAERIPDVVFELALDFGAGWAIDGELFGSADAGNICPGSHRRDTSFLLISGAPHVRRGTAVTPMDIAPSLLALLRCPMEGPLDGRSFVEA